MRALLAVLAFSSIACAPTEAAPPASPNGAPGASATAAPAAPALPPRPAEELKAEEEVIAARTRGLTPEGKKVSARLEAFPGVELPIARGRCYVAAVRVAPTARLGDVKLRTQMKAGDETASSASVAQPSAPSVQGGLYCPRAEGKLHVFYVDREKRARVTNAGQGEVTVELYAMPIPEADLQAAEAKAAEAREVGERVGKMPCSECDAKCQLADVECEKKCPGDRKDPKARRVCENVCGVATHSCEVLCAAQCR